jgi:Fungal N-terminal domain of STAND proteins
VLKEYKEMIDNIRADMEERLETIDARLKSISLQNIKVSGEERNNRIQIQDERDSTAQCLNICTQASIHTDQVQPGVITDILTPLETSLGPITTLNDLLAQLATDEALSSCKTELKDTSTQLEKRLQDLNARLQIMQPDYGDTSENQDTERQKVRDEYDTTKQASAICSEASEQATESRMNYFEDITMVEDGNQVIVSTIGDLISAKRVNVGPRSASLLGQMTDEALQMLKHSLGNTLLAKDAGDTPEAKEAFETRYGTGFKLKKNDELIVGSGDLKSEA